MGPGRVHGFGSGVRRRGPSTGAHKTLHTCLVFADGAVVYLYATIDTGDLSVTSPTTNRDADDRPILSPYGIWGALGTRAGEEGDVGYDYP